ncbi:MAG: hypothetical protein LBH59_11155 [Planctomycetaceae bacterium]|nr:hypothetical protein [Planctomycetaceae bacterium]
MPKTSFLITNSIPKPVWAVGFALEQTLRDAALAVFSFADFKTASAYLSLSSQLSLMSLKRTIETLGTIGTNLKSIKIQ